MLPERLEPALHKQLRHVRELHESDLAMGARLDEEWKKHRKRHKLDACGGVPTPKANATHSCQPAPIKAPTRAVSPPRSFRRTLCPHADTLGCPGWLKVIVSDLAHRPRRVQCTACHYCFEARELRIHGIDIEQVG
jgi:hypothetical protein